MKNTSKNLLFSLAGVATALFVSAAFAAPRPTPVPFPANVRPSQNDGQIVAAYKSLKVLCDSYQGAAPLFTSSAPSSSGVATVTVTNAAYVAIPSQAAITAVLVNTTGKSVGLKINGSAAAITIPTATNFTVKGISNLSNITVTNITDSTSISPTFYYEVQ